VNLARMGAAAGYLIAGGWATTLLLAVATGDTPSRGALAVVAAGMAAGLILARRRWDRDPGNAALLPVVAALHAAAAMSALDPSALLSIPFFLGAGALAGALERDDARVIRDSVLIASAALAVAALAPARGAEAATHAVILAPAIFLAASVAALLRARAAARPPRILLTGDAALVHAPLARTDRARLARLLELDEIVVAAALIERERRDAAERRRANHLLAEQLERTTVQMETEEIAPYVAPEDIPADDPEVRALIAQAERVLREDRARRALAAERLML
jgi:hypothetical protein